MRCVVIAALLGLKLGGYCVNQPRLGDLLAERNRTPSLDGPRSPGLRRTAMRALTMVVATKRLSSCRA
jgi:hypothetical protein